MTKTRILFILLFMMALTAACAKIEEKKPPIRIAVNVWAGYGHAFIAQELGFFKKNNVDVRLILKRDISESAGLYKNGETDGLFGVFADIIVIDSQGIPTKVVYAADFPDAGDVIVGRPELKSLSDMKGRTAGFEGINTFSHLFVLESLEKAGLQETDVRFKNINAMEVLTALEQGEIDAGHTWEPVKTRALNKGYKLLAKSGDVPGVITDVLAFNAKVIKERPADIRNIVKSLLEARDYIFSNRDKAMEIMSNALGMSAAEMDEGIRGVHFLNLKENIKAMEKSKDMTSFYSSGEMIAEFLIKRGQLSRRPDIEAIIESMFVKSLIGQ